MNAFWLRHRDALIILLSFLGALTAGGAFFLAGGVNPLEAYGAMFAGALGSRPALFSTLARAVPYVLGALSIAVAFAAGVWNIGAEGQLYMGAFGAALAGIFLPAMPSGPAMVLVLAFGVALGVLWAWIPGRLALDLGMNVVVVTIMFNAVAQYFTSYLVTGPLAGKNVSAGMTDRVQDFVRFARFSDLSVLHTGIFVALGAAVFVTVLMLWTAGGYEGRMIRLNPRCAAASGIPVRRRQLGAMALSGALAGLAGTLLVMGDAGRFLVGISKGYTWTGMILAMMVGYSPLGAVGAALVYAAMSAGALEMELLTDIPSEVVDLIVTTAVLFVTAGLAVANRLANRLRED